MAALPPPPGLQLSWLDDDVVAWQPGRGVYGGNLTDAVAQMARRPGLRSTSGPKVVPLDLPEGRANVMCQRLDSATLASLGQLGALGSDVSASVSWFGAMHRYAEALVTNGRVLPSVIHLADSWWLAEWHPLVGDIVDAGPLFASMPPVVRAAGPVDAAEVLHVMVDRLSRLTLIGRGWSTPLTDTRTTHARAVRAVTRALAGADRKFSVPGDLTEAVSHIAHEFRSMLRRADGCRRWSGPRGRSTPPRCC
ncbi:MAG: hypothetical protein WCI22_11930, partial [Actinomycetota bacterium]